MLMLTFDVCKRAARGRSLLQADYVTDLRRMLGSGQEKANVQTTWPRDIDGVSILIFIFHWLKHKKNQARTDSQPDNEVDEQRDSAVCLAMTQ